MSIIGYSGIRSGKSRKGQTLILEEVLMFSLGVTIIAGVIYLFNMVDDGVLEYVNNYQVEELMSLVKANAVMLEVSGCDKCHVVFGIPENIGGESYTLYGEGTKKKILIHNNNELWVEKNVSVEVYGAVSGNQRLMLFYEDGVVTMRGVDNF